MSEIFKECVQHPTDDELFRRSVLRAAIGRQTINFLGLRRGIPANTELSDEIIEALGVDRARSRLVNDCSESIANGSCTKFELETREGFSVRIKPRSTAVGQQV